MLLFALLIALGFFAACAGGDDDDDNDTSPADDDTGTQDDDTSADDDTSDDDAAELTWQWVPVDGVICRDGSASGIAVRANPASSELLIFLEGGGACYDAESCADNPSHFDETDLAAIIDNELVTGIFDTKNADNPVRDWDMVYVPYCTGDIFAGSQPDGSVPGVEATQQFVGFPNTLKITEYLGQNFSDAPRVLLSGTSAGGFGTITAYAPLADNFPGVPVTLIDDSGPFVDSNAALAPCYQLLLRLLWNANEAIPADCDDCNGFLGDGISNILPYLAGAYPLGRFGLFSTMEDATICDYWGMGQDFCTGEDPLPGDILSAALIDERDNFLIPTGKWSTFYIEGEMHGILTYDDTTSDWVSFYDTEIESTAFTAWLSNLIFGEEPLNVGP
jgi:hypothetical protein